MFRMKDLSRVLLLGALAIVLYDAIAALGSTSLGFPYSRTAYGSYLLYTVIGFFATRTGGTKGALAAGLTLGLVDATVGWAVSALIGPGRPPAGMSFTILMWLVVAVTFCITATICALLGALTSRFVDSRPKTA